ncbi:MAG: nitroreductase [Desulfobacterales bacterium]|nr:MAG: nitroreductase [Desulfobacterales bacterium]
MNSFEDLVKKNRSCRRFDNSYKLDRDTVEKLVGLTRYCASAANNQPLKYAICTEPDKTRQICGCLGWAGYLKDWKGPVPEEQPTAFVAILSDPAIATKIWCDDGIAAQTILLGARNMDLAGCMFGMFNVSKLKNLMNIPEALEVRLVLALGKPVEVVKVVDMKDNDVKYFRDENQIHHVPKRPVSELILAP